MYKFNLFLSVSILFFAVSCTTVAQDFKLPELKYEYGALEPVIDAKTMETHYNKHHGAYVNNLNKAVADTENFGKPIEEIMLNISKGSSALRNNGGGHYNHTLFWGILSPEPTTLADGALKKAIEESFGGLDQMKEAVNKAGGGQFGSGWAWVIVTPDQKLAVTSTPNQDNPLMDVVEKRGIPILGVDVWEHAYYLHYQNLRGDYLKKIWDVMDWKAVEANYNEALKSSLLNQLK